MCAGNVLDVRCVEAHDVCVTNTQRVRENEAGERLPADDECAWCGTGLPGEPVCPARGAELPCENHRAVGR